MKSRVLVYSCSALVALGLFFSATSADAGLVGAKTIHIRQNIDPNPSMQIAELQAFQSGSGTNVALASNGATASILNTTTTFGTDPTDAIDGSPAQDFGSGSVWHSGGETGATLVVDLAAATELESVRIFGRNPCCIDRQDDLQLIIFDAGGIEIHSEQILGLGSDPGDPDGVSNRLIILPNTIPEPSTAILAALGFLGLLGARRRRNRAK